MNEQLGQVLEVLFAALFNHLWQSTLFAAAIAGLALLLRRNGARVRYMLWLAASLKFLVPFAVVAALGALIPREPSVSEPGAVMPVVLEVAGNFAAPLSGDTPYPQIGANTRGMSAWQWTLLVLALVWVAGALFVMACWAVRWFEIQRALWSSVKHTGIDFPARVRVTSKQLEPGIVGSFLPSLLLPAGIEERLMPAQMQAVLAHERCHLRWRDNFTAWLHMWVETLFWFFPPVWWIGARMIEERERACDEQVAREGHAPASYAEGILAVCEHYIASRLPCVSGVSGADLRKRIDSIMKNVQTLELNRPGKIALAAIACCVVAAPLAAGAISGSWVHMLFSSAYTAGQAEYMQTQSALFEHLNRIRAGNGLALTCPAPDQDFIDRRRRLSAEVAKLSPDDGEKVLLFAVAANSTRDVQRLLDSGAVRGGDGLLQSNSLMNIAAQFADAPMLELLAGAGFDIDERGTGGIGNLGGTPLMAAISAGRLDNAEWLMRHGADVSAVDTRDNSALLQAMISCSDQALVTRLINAGAVPNDKARYIAKAKGMNLDTAPRGTSLMAATAPDDKAPRGSTKASPPADPEPALIVPNGLPLLEPISGNPDDRQFVVVSPSGDQPLFAPPSFVNLPPPLTDEQLQQEWRRPDQKDLDAEPLRSASATGYTEVTADFDGDGKPDRAVLRVEAAGWKEGLFVQLSSVLPGRWQPLNSVVHNKQSQPLLMGVSLVPPGTYMTACGKGYGRCSPDEPREVVLKHPGIDYFQFESANSYIFWDETTRQLRRVWISD